MTDNLERFEEIVTVRKKLEEVMNEVAGQLNRAARDHPDHQLRIQQLGEIRAMLRLSIDATHEAVCKRLLAIGAAGQVIDLDALPERYAHARRGES